MKKIDPKMSSVLNRVIAKSKDKTAIAKDRKIEKKRRKIKLKSSEESVVYIPKEENKPKNSTDVHGWFEEKLREIHGDNYSFSRWTLGQKKLAKDLLKIYGDDLVKKAVFQFCEDWNNIVEWNPKFSGSKPNVNLLWGMRENVFGCVQTGDRIKSKKSVNKKNSDEYIDDPSDEIVL